MKGGVEKFALCARHNGLGVISQSEHMNKVKVAVGRVRRDIVEATSFIIFLLLLFLLEKTFSS